MIFQNQNKLQLHNPSRFLPGNNLLILVGVLTVALILAIYFGVSIGQGDYFETYMVMLLLGTPAVLFILKGNYWIFIPFAIRCGLPAIPLFAGRALALSEVWVSLCVVMLAGQLILYRSRRPQFARIELIPIYIIMVWVVIMFYREGIGLSIFGSSVYGGRKYLGIALAFAALIVIMHQSISEKQCKWLVVLIVSSVGVAMIVGLLKFFFFKRVDIYQEYTQDFYSYHQLLGAFPVMIATWIFSKYSPLEIVVKMRLKMMALLGISYTVILYSGKRSFLAFALVLPVIASLIRRQYIAVVMYGAVSMLFLSILLVGQGNFFNLPRSMERSLSFVSYIPGIEWDSALKNLKKTNFRSTLNDIAWDKIKEFPLRGNGLAITQSERIEFESMEEYATEDVDTHAYKMAAASAWHNTWLGISTDFGIPCALLFAIFWIQIFRYAFRLRRELPMGSYARLLVTLILIMNAGDLVQSWVAGHSLEEVLWWRGWQFGILVALKWQMEEGNMGIFAPPVRNS